MRQDIYVISPANVRNLVHAIIWRDGPPAYPASTQNFPDFPSTPELPVPSIVLRLAGVSYKFNNPQAEIMIGRDPTCDIVVDHKKASRKVSREQAKLPEKGWITLGHLYHQNGQFRIEFEVIPARI